ncbi:MAG: hypothetical protein ACQEXM_27665 [Actinomycetota bacterium]
MLLPLVRSVVASAVWAGLGQRSAAVLSRGVIQVGAGCSLSLGMVLLCGPAVVAIVVGAVVTGGAALLVWRRVMPVVVPAAGLVLGAGLLLFPVNRPGVSGELSG